MKTGIGCFLLVVAAVVGYHGLIEFAIVVAFLGLGVLLLGKGNASVVIGFGDSGDSGDGCGGGCGGD
jgi:hypothetical protein